MITSITAQCATQGTALQAQAQHLQHDLQQIMRRFGRQCRGMGKVFVTLVRQTETQLLELGRQVLPLARAAQQRLHSMPHCRRTSGRACTPSLPPRSRPISGSNTNPAG